MIDGMLWCSLKGTVEERIEEGVAHYKKKYKTSPSVCHVHPETTKLKKVSGIKIVKDTDISTNNFWIGVEDE